MNPGSCIRMPKNLALFICGGHRGSLPFSSLAVIKLVREISIGQATSCGFSRIRYRCLGGLAHLQRRPPIFARESAVRSPRKVAFSCEFAGEPAGLPCLRVWQELPPLARAQPKGGMAQHNSLRPDGGNVRGTRNWNVALPLHFSRGGRSALFQLGRPYPGGRFWGIRGRFVRAASPVRPSAQGPRVTPRTRG